MDRGQIDRGQIDRGQMDKQIDGLWIEDRQIDG